MGQPPSDRLRVKYADRLEIELLLQSGNVQEFTFR